MKLHRLTLKCFRGFPDEETMEFNGKNVLVYGENGSGKSTLFHAIREFFPLNLERRPIEQLRNRFIEPDPIPTVPPVPLPPTTAFIELEFRGYEQFENPASATTKIFRWDVTTPTGKLTGWEMEIARRLGALDYRALLETHFVQRKDKEVDILRLLVEGLLGERENPITHLPFRSEWENFHLKAEKDAPSNSPRHKAARDSLNKVINEFAGGFGGELTNPAAPTPETRGLQEKANELLRQLVQRDPTMPPELVIQLRFRPPFYNGGPRRITDEGAALLTATLNGLPVPHPATFLNEARLTAIALALYLAALKHCVPPPQLGADNHPRLLVLDDVLIGLDLAHRLPLLELLEKEFPDWQVLLLTHDRAWFELAQLVTNERNQWMSMQLHAERTQNGAYVFERPKQTPPIKELQGYYLSLAEHHLDVLHDPRTAAFHTRVAFEVKLKTYCLENSVTVPYYLDGVHLDTEQYLKAIESWLQEKCLKARAAFILRRVRLFRARVLNPLSHWSPVVIDASEVRRAINVVRELKFTIEEVNFTNEVKKAMGVLAPSAEELLNAASWLRTAFEVDVRKMLLAHHGKVEYRVNWSELTEAHLWDAAKERMLSVNAITASPLIADVETHRHVFLDPWEYARISILTKLQLDAAWAALRDPGHQPKTRLSVFA